MPPHPAHPRSCPPTPPQVLALDIRPVHAGRSPWPGAPPSDEPPGAASGRRRAGWRAERLAAAETPEAPTRFELDYDGAHIVWRVRPGTEHAPPPPLGAPREEGSPQVADNTLWVCVEDVTACSDNAREGIEE